MREINHLTNDEDLRQELWLHFLEGNSLLSFQEYLQILQLNHNNTLSIYKNVESSYGIKT